MAAGDGVPVVVRGWPWPRRVCGKEIRRAIRAHRRAGRVRGTGCSASRLQHICEFTVDAPSARARCGTAP